LPARNSHVLAFETSRDQPGALRRHVPGGDRVRVRRPHASTPTSTRPWSRCCRPQS
jgi:hypothetical protein